MFNSETNTLEIDEDFVMEPKGRLGACRYCGEMVLAEYTDEMTTAERDDMATQFCVCPAAKAVADKQAQKQGAKRKIQQLFGEDAEKKGLSPVSQDIIEIMEGAIELISAEQIWSISIELEAGGKGKLSRNNKDKINVERTETQKYKLEG
ncbi:MAG: hypothetical protein WCS30_00185 [Selenomonadaceae bacterium]